MHTLIQEDFNGVGVGHHRELLIKRLDYIIQRLDAGPHELGTPPHKLYRLVSIPEKKRQYGELRRALLKVDGGTLDTLTRMPPR